MSKKVQLSLFLVALLSQAHASQNITLTPLTITSTAIQTDELQSTDAVEVYTAEDIEKTKAQNLYEFLNRSTSISALPSYGNPFAQLIDIHGYGATNGHLNIVITVNGRKLNNIDSVPQLLTSISPASIEKIEIIKSSGIVTGGDGANAGAIHITTKKNNDKELSLYGGTYTSYKGSMYLGHSDETFSASFSGEATGTDGIRYIDNQGHKDKNSLRNGIFNLTYNPNQKLELYASAEAIKSDVLYGGAINKTQYDSDPTQFSGTTNHQIAKATSVNGGFRYHINDVLTMDAQINHEKKKSAYLASWGTPQYYTNDSAKLGLEYTNDHLALRTGIDLFDGERRQNTNTTTKDNYAVFIASEYYLTNSTFKVGYRQEKVSYSYNSATSHLTQDDKLSGVELGYNYKIDAERSFFLNYAHSYMAPDVDKFFNWGGTFNSFINPMKTDNYTLGFNHFTNINKFKISFYYINLKDEIYYYKTAFKNTNIDKSHKYGVDIFDKFILNNQFNIVLNYNYVKAIIDEEIEGTDNYANKELPGVSNHSIKATLNYSPTTNTLVSLIQIYRSKAYAAEDFNNNFTQKQDAYKSIDISMSYTLGNYELFATINNLFNQKNGIWISDKAIYPVNFTTTALAGFKYKY